MSSAAYTIAANLEMKSNVPSVLTTLLEGFERLDKVIRESQKGIVALAEAVSTLKGAGRSLGALEKAMDKLGKNEGARQGAQQAETFARATKEAASAQETLARATREAATAQKDLNATRGRMSAGRAASAGTSRQSTGGRSSPAAAGHGVDSTDAMMVGMAGHSAVSFVESAAHQAMEPAQVMSMMRTNAGNSEADIQRSYDVALAATRSAPGTNLGKNMEATLDIANVLGSLPEAIETLPKFAQLSSVFAAVDKRQGGSGDQGFAAAKAMEVLGMLTKETKGADGSVKHEIDPAGFQQHMEAMMRVIVASGGRVAPTDYLQYAKQGRVGAMQQDDRFTFQQLPALLMVLGGQRTGTAVNSMNTIFNGGHMLEKTMDAFMKAGLADASGIQREQGRDGKMHNVVHPEAIENIDMMKTNLVEYIRTSTSKMAAEGKSSDAILTVLQTLGQRSTVGGAWADIYKNLPSIDKEEARVKGTLQGPGAIDAFVKSNPEARLNAFHESFNNLLAVLGGPVLEKALPLIDSLAGAMNKLGDVFSKNSTLAVAIMGTIAAVGGLAVAIGSLGVAAMFAGSGFKLLGGIGRMFGVGAAGGLGAGVEGAAGGAAGGILSRVGSGIAGFLGMGVRAAPQLAVAGAVSYGIKAGLDAGSDRLERAMGLDPAKRALSSFSIFDKSTWRDPNSGYFSAMPMTPGQLDARQQSAPASAIPAGPTTMQGTVNLDGRAVGQFVANSLARGANMPSVGPQPGARGGGMSVPGNAPANP